MGGEAGLEVCLDDVLNVGEIPALAAVPVDGGDLAVEELADKARDDRGVGPVGVLAAAEDVEIAQAVGVQAVVEGVLPGPFLVAVLADGVGTQQIPLSPLPLGQVRLVAVNGAGGGVDEFLHAGLPGGLQHVQGAGDVVGAVEEGHFDGPGNGAPGGLVEDVIHALAGPQTGIQVLDVAQDKLVAGIAREEVHVFPLAGGQVVQTADPVP